MRGRMAFPISLLLVCLVALGACAPKGPILVAASYRAPESVVSAPAKMVVGLSTFKDVRQVAPSVVGQKLSLSSEKENDLVIQGSVTDLVAKSFREAMTKRGVPVKTVRAWDLTDKGLPATDADIVIGGEIEKLWTEAVTGTLNVKYAVAVRISVSVADPAQKRVTRKLVLNTSMERRDVSFSSERAGDMLSESLSSSVDQLLNNTDFQQLLEGKP
jgi:hypothetical protein